MVHRFEADHDLSGWNDAEGAELLQIRIWAGSLTTRTSMPPTRKTTVSPHPKCNPPNIGPAPV
ncbi:hypothetical protein NKH50_11045 [Mesorhizobium sp. M1027]